jgi:hypothetical protein
MSADATPATQGLFAWLSIGMFHSLPRSLQKDIVAVLARTTRGMLTLAALAIVPALIAPAVRGQQATWPDEFRAGQFCYHADFSLAPYRQFLAGMPEQHADVVQALGIEPATETIHVFLFRQRATYEKYLKQYFPEVPTRKALFIKSQQHGPGMVFAYLGDDFEIDVRHECTHAMLNAALPMVPLWLDEGLAEYFEVAPDERAASHPHHSLIQWSVRFAQIPKIEDLEDVRNLSQMTRSRYRQAWAWVHFMLHGPAPVRDELKRYLADIQAHTPPDRLSRRLRVRAPDLDRQFAEHFKTFQP